MTTIFDGLRRAARRVVEKDTTYLQLSRWVGRRRADLEQWGDTIERARTHWRAWRATHEPEIDTAAPHSKVAMRRAVESDAANRQLTPNGQRQAALEQWRDAIERAKTRWRAWRAKREPEIDTAAAMRVEVDAWVQIQVHADLAERHLDDAEELYDCWAAAWEELSDSKSSGRSTRRHGWVACCVA